MTDAPHAEMVTAVMVKISATVRQTAPAMIMVSVNPVKSTAVIGAARAAIGSVRTGRMHRIV